MTINQSNLIYMLLIRINLIIINAMLNYELNNMTGKKSEIQGQSLGLMASSLIFMITRHAESGVPSFKEQLRSISLC